MALKIGSLFSGYGGLDLAVQSVYDAEHAWFCEFDPAPSKILAHHWPDVPNLHDVTTVDWSTVEPIDILTGGFPCQDVSVAGRRAGMADGTRSGLWSHMAHAIDVLRPELVVIENVGGLFSAKAASTVEPHPLCMGADGTGRESVPMRAMPAVLSTLSELGYDAEWTALRASDVGAPHGRLRVFITAHPGGSRSGRWHFVPFAGGAAGPDVAPHRADSGLGSPRNAKNVTLLPTPRAADSTGVRGRTPNRSDAANAKAGLTLTDACQDTFGPYAPAIDRWEQTLGRPAPAPAEPGKNRPRLSSRFVEWLMGLPDGHVTGVPGLTRNQQLKALGNGVVPQQGAAALAHLHRVREGAA